MNTPTIVARLCAAAALLAPLSLLAAEADETLKGLGLVTLVEPVFPDAARIDGVADGHVTVAFRRTPAGEPQDILVLEATHSRLAAAALEAVQQWRFQPTANAADLEPRTVRISFRLQGIVVYPFGKNTIETVAGDDGGTTAPKPVNVPRLQMLARMPKALNQPMPGYPASLAARKLEGRAAVRFYVDEDGRVRLPEVIEATAPEFGEAAVAAVAQWRYEPPKDGGRRIVASDHWQFQFKATN